MRKHREKRKKTKTKS